MAAGAGPPRPLRRVRGRPADRRALARRRGGPAAGPAVPAAGGARSSSRARSSRGPSWRTRLWGTDTFVDAAAGLNTAVAKLREALGDDADRPIYIETLPKRGYRFVARVEKRAGEPSRLATGTVARAATRVRPDRAAAAPALARRALAAVAADRGVGRRLAASAAGRHAPPSASRSCSSTTRPDGPSMARSPRR